MNIKTQRIIAEMDKVQEKIAALQARYRELERQKADSESTEILELVRKASLNPESLAAFLHGLKAQDKPVSPFAESRLGTKQEDVDNEE